MVEHLLNNLMATEKHLRNTGHGNYAHYVRQALDRLYPSWRDKE